MTGLFFGSFDPPHIGHINMAISAINSKLVDDVIFIPAYGNPFKKNQTPFSLRYKMLEEMIDDDYDNIGISSIESAIHSVTSNDKIYTFDVLDYITKMKMFDFKIITTEETYNEIPNWTRGYEILENYNFIIGISEHLSNGIFIPRKSSDEIFNIENDIDISSTKVRKIVHANKIPIPFINNKVYTIIKNNKLYD